MNYGRVKTVVKLEDGDFTNEQVLMGGKVVDAHQRYEVRSRVLSEQQELTAWLKFRDETRGYKTVEFKVEHTDQGDKDGFWYVVCCWTTAK